MYVYMYFTEINCHLICDSYSTCTCAVIMLLLEVACGQCTVVLVGWLRFGLVCGYSEGLQLCALSTQMCTLLLVYTHVHVHVHVFTLLACACKGCIIYKLTSLFSEFRDWVFISYRIV